MNLRQTTFLVIALTMAAALVACGSSSKPAPVVSIAATAGTPQSALVGAAFGTQLQATVTTGGTPTNGVSVTFTAPGSGASGTFADGGTPAATDTETTNSSGVATSTVFTANDAAGSYTITATVTGATSPADFSMSNTSGAAASILAASGSGQSATISTAFAAPLVANVVDAYSNPVSGVSVTFTAPATDPTGTFANETATETDTTDASGNATSTTFTANATAGGPYNVVASSAGLTSVNFVLTNNAGTAGALGAGNYVFSVQGTDSGSASSTAFSPYFAAGVFAVDGAGNVTGGEMSFSDYNDYVQEAITGGNVTVNPADSNLLITINTGDTNIGPGASTPGGGSGTLVFSAAMASSTKGLLSEYDSWATSTGELNAQTSTAALCPSAAPATPCGYAIYLAGLDYEGYQVSVGGVVTIDGSGSISGTGSVFDLNDAGNLNPANAVSASTVSAPDSMGYVTITVNSGLFGGNPAIVLDGYIVDANHIRLVENTYVDYLESTTGGTALAQTGTGGFTGSSISGATYVVGMPGADTNGPLQVAGMLTFNADTTVSGNLSFNDIVAQSPQGGTAITGGNWADDGSGTGRVLVTGATDGVTFSYNLVVYQTGDGHATVISMDNYTDVLAGVGKTQASGLGVSSLTGNYTLSLNQIDGTSGWEFDGDGQVTASAGTLTGFTDENGSLLGAGLVPDKPLNGSYSGSAGNPIIFITGNGGSPLTLYLVDGTQAVVIENDNSQLTLGYATSQ